MVESIVGFDVSQNRDLIKYFGNCIDDYESKFVPEIKFY